MTKDAMRAAFEEDFFGGLPMSVPAREFSRGMYRHSSPQYAWTVWQRAWAKAHENARLIAAAPDLLDFARWVLSINCGATINKRARELIAKATGEKQ